MMATANNTTSTLDGNINLADLVVYGVYAIEGLCIFTAGVLIALPVFYHRALRIRKEYVIVGAMAVSDGLYGLAYLLASIYRVALLLNDTAFQTVTRWFCWTRPFRFLWIMFNGTSVLMWCVVSVDRLLIVAFPFWYLRQTATMSWCLVAIAYGHGVVELIISGVVAYVDGDRLRPNNFKMCYMNGALHPYHMDYQLFVFTWVPVASVVIYALVVVFYILRNKKIASTNNDPDDPDGPKLALQRRLTKSLGVSAACTLLLFVLPLQFDIHIWQDIIEACPFCEEVGGFDADCTICQNVSTLLWSLANVNYMINFVIFLVRQPEIRMALSAICRGKTMPLDVTMWKSQTAAPQS